MQRAWLAAAILTERPDVASNEHPDVPDESDLIGFVTTGNFSLKEGAGVGIGSVRMDRVISDKEGWENGQGDSDGSRRRNYCIVRDAGEAHGRLAEWDFV